MYKIDFKHFYFLIKMTLHTEIINLIKDKEGIFLSSEEITKQDNTY